MGGDALAAVPNFYLGVYQVVPPPLFVVLPLFFFFLITVCVIEGCPFNPLNNFFENLKVRSDGFSLHLPVADLLPLIDGHFDTSIGAKVDAASYQAIISQLGEDVTFVSAQACGPRGIFARVSSAICEQKHAPGQTSEFLTWMQLLLVTEATLFWFFGC